MIEDRNIQELGFESIPCVIEELTVLPMPEPTIVEVAYEEVDWTIEQLSIDETEIMDMRDDEASDDPSIEEAQWDDDDQEMK